jgi:hypothetical protein
MKRSVWAPRHAQPWQKPGKWDQVPTLLLLLLLLPSALSAQGRHEFTLDFRPFAGLAAYAWQLSPGTYFGLGLGGGIDELDFTLVPFEGGVSNDEFHQFEEIAHASAFVRRKAGTHWDFDVGARAGIGEVRSCMVSDCLPGWFFGGYANVFWGSSRWKVGPRIIVAQVHDDDNGDTVVHLEILTGRVRIGR